MAGATSGDEVLGDDRLSQRLARGRGYGREVGFIDLGHEPPLSVDGSEAAVIDRRRISVQWFSGTILTGLCGAALIGGAVFASLDGETTFAKPAERVEAALRGGIGSRRFRQCASSSRSCSSPCSQPRAAAVARPRARRRPRS